MEKLFCSAVLACAGVAAAASPQVTDVSVSESADRTVTVGYTLSEAAVVTMDVETNAGDSVWLSIGGKNISGTCPPAGDVFKKVTAAGAHAFTWDPDTASSDGGFAFDATKCRITVRAWAEDDLPDYVVVSLAKNLASTAEARCAFYPDADYLPGGLIENNLYRTGAIVLRRIHAKGSSFLMGYTHGSPWDQSGVSKPHQVFLDADYYIGVFELTMAQQYALGSPATTYKPSFKIARWRRPSTSLSYGTLRSGNRHVSTDAYYPLPPGDASVLGMLYKQTGVAFDIPSEAQWEFACKAGEARDQYWNDGALVGPDKDCGATMPGRCLNNAPGGYIAKEDMPSDVGVTNGTAFAGSYRRNDWGLYDMHGNISEWCLDWYADDITGLNGAVNANGSTLADGKTTGTKRILRGGGWSDSAYVCESECRSSRSPSDCSSTGCRLASPANLKR